MTETLFSPEPGAGAPARPGSRPADATAQAPAGRPAIVITVLGNPVGQGSIRHGKTGMAYHANGKILKPWRTAVETAAVDAIGRHAYAAPKARKGVAGRPAPICTTCGTPKKRHGLYLGPVGLSVVATFARPKSDPRRAYPITSNIGDWDHHGRSISDALTGVVFADDAQIVTAGVVKTYPGGHRDALDEPGVVIRCWEVS